MSEQGTVVRTHGRETFHRDRGEAGEGKGKDWPLAAPILGAVVGIYVAAVVGVYELVTSAGPEVLEFVGWVTLVLTCGFFAFVLAREIERQRLRMRERRSVDSVH
jgi:hypothetical protein